MPGNGFASKTAKQEAEKRERLAKQARQLMLTMQSAAVLKLQCAYRCRLAKKLVADQRKPHNVAEVLEARRKIFLADRAAARKPGYATSRGTGALQVQYERQRILSERSARRAEQLRAQGEESMREATLERYRALVRAHERLALGLQWKGVDEKPSNGSKELHNAALGERLNRGQTEFTRPELLAYGISQELGWKSYVYDSWGNCFVPTGREEAREAARIAQDRTWADAQVLPIRFRGLSRRQLSMVAKEQGKGGVETKNSKAKDGLADVSDALPTTPKTPSGLGIGRVRRLSGEVIDVARRASRASHDALKKMLSA
jgi:hypothetical protein